jgi:hypothetical protein
MSATAGDVYCLTFMAARIILLTTLSVHDKVIAMPHASPAIYGRSDEEPCVRLGQ